MALTASNFFMRSFKGIAGQSLVIELYKLPTVAGMAIGTGLSWLGCTELIEMNILVATGA
ncbi:MAG: hypothetical protein ACE5FH_11780 [Candidatus Zixiibacteriota bacterium]